MSNETSTPGTTVETSLPTSTSSTDSVTVQDNSTVITSNHFEMLLQSFKATQANIDNNQVTIQALVSKLVITSSALENTSKRLLDLSDQVQTMNLAITKTIPNEIQSNVTSIQNDLWLDFSTAIANFSTKVYQGLNNHHSESIQCFKSHASSLAHLATDVSDLSKTLSIVQDTALSKLDVERIVVQKWQDELDPHIQSHYDLQKEVANHFSTLDHTIKSSIENHPLFQQNSSSQASVNPRQRPPASSSFGFHQMDSKDFSVSKLQKELKDIKL
jgi:predicted transcriptional regulator